MLNTKKQKLASAIQIALFVSAATLVSGTAFAQSQQEAKSLDTITVTGSRIKRAEVEGALPVTVIGREQLASSGDVSVADYLRDTNFNSFGSYQSTSGSSGQGASTISLRGLGAGRTLVLVDGRRAPVAPMLGEGQDLNSIPMAAVERIEVLTDGASSVYGSDAIGGVVNIITRKDYEGIEFSIGKGLPTEKGGDTEEMSVLMGASGERGRVLAGASYSKRDVVFTRDRDYWYDEPGASIYSNNFASRKSTAVSARLAHPTYGTAVPGLCTNGNDGDLFYLSDDKVCQYNHSAISAQLTGMKNTAVFARGDFQINDDWNVYFNTSVTRTNSFGRYAPVPSSPWPGGAIELKAGTPNHPATLAANGGLNPHAADPYYQSLAGKDVYLYHRFAALGPRDGGTENTTYNFLAGFEGRVGEVDLDFGMRYGESKAAYAGLNYVVGGLAQQAITAGKYNIYDPFAGNPQALGFTATISRDMKTSVKEVYGSASFDLFQLGGGTAAAVVGVEHRQETYRDIYDPLSESGQIVGSAGNSAAGNRKVTAGYFEVLLPFANSFEANIAGRYDKYSDYGADFSPKVSLRWHPLEAWTFRGSYGQGFRAPSLDVLLGKTSFSAERTTDPQTCQMLAGRSYCTGQVNTYRLANPNLESETSKQWSLGAVWDVTDWLNLSLDYYNIRINNQISFVTIGTIAGCLRGSLSVCPSGLTTFPANTTLPNEALGLGAEFDLGTGGIVKAQTGYQNFGYVKNSGYDFNLRTNFNFENFGALRNHFSVSLVDNYSTNGAESVVGRKGSPRMRAALTNTWSKGPVDVSWNVSYIHGTQSGAYREWLRLSRIENRNGVENYYYNLFGAAPKRLPSWLIHNVQASVKTPWNGTVAVGVNNVANKVPVYEKLYGGTDYDSTLYDPWGRVVYFRYTQKF